MNASSIRLWTIQPSAVWEQIASRGTLTVDPRHAADLHDAYEWLRAELGRRIPGYTGCHPWWAHCTRPDLRRARHERNQGERYVLIELCLPRPHAVVFPAWAWDRIYYGEFVSGGRREALTWERRMRAVVPDEGTWPLPEPWRSELEASWQRLFHPDLPVRGWPQRRVAPLSEREAVFEVLERRHIVGVTSFLGAKCPSAPA